MFNNLPPLSYRGLDYGLDYGTLPPPTITSQPGRGAASPQEPVAPAPTSPSEDPTFNPVPPWVFGALGACSATVPCCAIAHCLGAL